MASPDAVLGCNGKQHGGVLSPWPTNTNRAVNDWDDISLPTPLPSGNRHDRAPYDTVDAGQGWERGWRIDDINIDRCVIDTPF
jgi:hypothetical protein